MDPLSAELLKRFGAGEVDAAEELLRRFEEKLIAFAAARISGKLARRVDPEDVVQSAYRSFFVGARQGRFVLQRSGDLWCLLVGITLNKLHTQVERHGAGKRALSRERASSAHDSSGGLAGLALAREPTPAEAVALADEVEGLLRRLDAKHRPILEMRLQGHKIDEIAHERNCSERTVRRVLEQVKGMLEQS